MLATARKTITIAALLCGTSALAAAPDWRFSEIGGQVTVTRSGKAVPATRRAVLREGDVVRTGPSGRAVLVRGKEYLVVSPGSHLRIAQREESGPVTQVIQYLGNVLFRIEKKSTPHFGVETPYMAAVVKGTTFNVTVSDGGTSVQVTEGAVEVATSDALDAALLTPGLLGFVDADNLGELVVLVDEDRFDDASDLVVRGAPQFVSRLAAAVPQDDEDGEGRAYAYAGEDDDFVEDEDADDLREIEAEDLRAASDDDEPDDDQDDDQDDDEQAPDEEGLGGLDDDDLDLDDELGVDIDDDDDGIDEPDGDDDDDDTVSLGDDDDLVEAEDS